jgi:hypothetical protein
MNSESRIKPVVALSGCSVSDKLLGMSNNSIDDFLNRVETLPTGGSITANPINMRAATAQDILELGNGLTVNDLVARVSIDVLLNNSSTTGVTGLAALRTIINLEANQSLDSFEAEVRYYLSRTPAAENNFLRRLITVQPISGANASMSWLTLSAVAINNINYNQTDSEYSQLNNQRTCEVSPVGMATRQSPVSQALGYYDTAVVVLKSIAPIAQKASVIPLFSGPNSGKLLNQLFNNI